MIEPPNALCFGANLPPTGAPCRVDVTAMGLSIRSDYAMVPSGEGLIPFHALSVAAGGFEKDHLVVEWGSGQTARTLYLKAPDLVSAFRRAAPSDLTGPLERVAEDVRRARRRHRSLWGVGLASLLALMLVLWFGSDLIVKWAVHRIPVEWEDQLGAAAHRQMLAGQPVIKAGAAVEAVQEIMQRLTAQLPDNPYAFKVVVVRSEVVNAMALPGGYVTVFSGLLREAATAEEVAGVLSHEISHVLKRHGMERIVKQLGLAAVVTIVLGDQQGLVRLVQRLGMELVALKFSREQETEADLSGLQLLHAAHIDPEGMITFFSRLSEQDRHQLELFSTHPMSASRAERLKRETAALPDRKTTAFSFEWDRVRESLIHDHTTVTK